MAPGAVGLDRVSAGASSGTPEVMSHRHRSYTRDESEAQRLDRNYSEQLQELRIAQAGVQILFAFLLTIPFQQRFSMLNRFQLDVYLVTLSAAAVAVIVFTAPVAMHRVLFREGVKDFIVRYTDRLAIVGLLALAISIIGGTVLVLDVLVAHETALSIGAALALLALVLWLLLPIWQKRKTPPGEYQGGARPKTEAHDELS
jgi:hypothetical protein